MVGYRQGYSSRVRIGIRDTFNMIEHENALKRSLRPTGTDRVSFGAVQVCIIARRPRATQVLKFNVQGWVRRAGDAFAAHPLRALTHLHRARAVPYRTRR